MGLLQSIGLIMILILSVTGVYLYHNKMKEIRERLDSLEEEISDILEIVQIMFLSDYQRDHEDDEE